MPPSYFESPETKLAEQVLGEEIRGAVPVVNTSVSSYVDQSKMVASMQIANVPPEVALGGGIIPPSAVTAPYEYRQQPDLGPVQAAALPLIPIVTGGISIIYWLSRALAIPLGALGLVNHILDLFEFGRIFIYIRGDSFGSLPPQVAFTWWYLLRQDRQRVVKLRMEAADKGGISGAIPPIRGFGPQADALEGGKSPWEKINPFEGGSFFDRINPFVAGSKTFGDYINI